MIKLTPVTLILILVPFLSFVSPSCLYVYSVICLLCFLTFHHSFLLIYFFIFVPVISSCIPESGTPGHILVSTHLHTKHTVWMCVFVCVRQRESGLVLNFHFNQHVSKRTILLPQGRTEGPLHNLSLTVSFPLPRLVPSLHPSFSETTN